ncbi:cysteine--tRNA ligase [Devosia sp.]|uniref:cysteine--tRNA ligase n=1 Tax=Devosia sp. TaxID=1871048 RepID=UPI003BA84CB5
MGETTSLRLYNTLTRTKEVFAPIDPANVRMYVCGPTVYDFAHIGNARPVIVFDLLFRLLRHLYGAEHVTYVRNITDVDDKINARAVRDFPGLPLNEAIRKVTETTAAQYQKDTLALGALEPTVQPRATDNIPQMQSLITSLIGSRHAYEAAGEVLFDVSSMPDYGKLSGRNLDENLAGARIAVDAHKKNPADFVLWKQSSAEEPGWDSPWGRGRPGWHIECSAMSERYLGPVFDIHAGGLDLIFPHHENEIAQSRCAHGTLVMANYWLHNGFLQVEGQKMSKSLGNFITIDDVLRTEVPVLTAVPGDHFELRHTWNGLTARLSMLQTHYREPIDWTEKRFDASREELMGWYETLRDVSFDAGVTSKAAPQVWAALADDLNAPLAISHLRAAAKTNPRALGEGMMALGLLDASLIDRDDLLLFDRQAGADDGQVQESIAARLTALNTRDFAKADQIRNDLLAQGIQLMDYKDESGQRQTKWEVKR